MPDKKATVSIIVIILILIIGVGATRRNKPTEQKVDLPFTENELDALGNKINSLEIEDIQGLNPDNSTIISFTLNELDNLGSSIENLDFEDLEGLSST